MSLPDEHSSSPLCSLSVEFRLKVHIGAPKFRSRRARRQDVPPPYSETRNIDSGSDKNQENKSQELAVVRQGCVHVTVQDRSRNRGFDINWLVLTNTDLALYAEESKAPEIIIPLSDIAKLERTEHETLSLIMETQGNKTYLLAFRTDDDLYDWKDDISLRITGISNPWNFKHNVHVGRDGVVPGVGLPFSENLLIDIMIIQRLSAEWAKVLLCSPEPPAINTSQPPSTFGHRKPPAPMFQTIESSERILLRVNIETRTAPGHYSLGLSV
ncbi:hypothetical protein C8R45DRAFT_847942 [Mycena sanguinolenta]|nr:hypothetical protein C8R45DRAFT_847942 [Mycena sanguinolenta]